VTGSSGSSAPAPAHQLFDFTTARITGTTATNSTLTLAQNVKYFVTVRATNGAGLQATATPDASWRGLRRLHRADSPTLGANWTTQSGPSGVSAEYAQFSRRR